MTTWASPTENTAVWTSPDQDERLRGLFDEGVFDTAVFDDLTSSGAVASPEWTSPTKN